MKKISLLVIAVLLFSNSYAQNSHHGHNHSLEMQIWHRAQLEMNYTTFQELSTNGLLVHAKYENGKAINDFTEHELEVLQELGFQAEILIEDVFMHDAQNFNPVIERSYTDGSYQTPSNFAYGTTSGRNGMWTYTEVNQILDQMRSLYPNLISEKTNHLNGVDYFSNHYDVNQRKPIHWIKISDNPSTNESSEVKVFLNACTHGNEGTGLASLLFFMWYLLENYDNNPQIKQLVDHTEIIIIPVVNPDGLDLNLRGNRKTSTSSVDLNRNFAYAWSSSCTGCYAGTAAFSETESQFVRDMYNTFNFGAVESLHSFYEGILHPFSCDPSLNPGQCSGLTGTSLTNYQQLTGFQRSRNYYRAGSFFQLLGYAGPGCSIDWMYKGNTLSGSNKANYQTYATLTEVGTAHWYPNINDMIRVCKENMHNLLSTVRLAGTYAELQETTSSILTQNSGNLSVQFKRYGLKDGNFEVSCEAFTPNISFDTPITITNPAAFSSQTVSIPYTLNSISTGDEVIFKLKLNNGNYTIEDTIRKVYNGSNIYASGLGNLSDGTTVLTSSQFSLTSGDKAMLTFQTTWNLKRQYSSSTPSYSSVKLEISSNGTTWFPLKGKFSGDYNETILQSYTGLQNDIVREYIDLTDYVGQTNLRIRASLSKYSTGNSFSMTNIEIINPETVPICTTPTVNSSTPASRCGAGSITISATPSSGASIKWFDAAVGGNEILAGNGISFNGNELIHSNLTATTTFYAEAVDGSCESAARTAVTATVNNCTTQLQSLSGSITLTSMNTNLPVVVVPGATNYRVELRLTNGTFVMSGFTGTNTFFNLNWFQAVKPQYNTVYNVRVAAIVGGIQQPYGPSVTVRTPSVSLASGSCGVDIPTMETSLNVTTVPGATSYDLRITLLDGTFIAVASTGGNPFFKLSWLQAVPATLNTTYRISVAPVINGIRHPFGPLCTVRTPISSTELVSTSCNATLPSLSSVITTIPVSNATGYRFEFRRQSDNTVVAIGVRDVPALPLNLNDYRLSWRPELETGMDYNVRVAVQVNGVWSSYGTSCPISISAPGGIIQNENGNANLGEEQFLTVFPNPNNGTFTASASKPGDFVLLNSLGQIIQHISLTEENLKIEITNLSSGMYFLSGTVDGQQLVEKVIVE